MSKLDDFATSVQTKSHAWDAWPDQLREDIAYVLEQKDAGSERYRRFSVMHMREWAKAQYKLDVSDMALRRYAMEVLGRRSWAAK